MESKAFWGVIFAVIMLLAAHTSQKVEKNVLDNFDEQTKEWPFIKKLLLGIINIYPYRLLTPAGRTWQNLTLLLTIPLAISGYQLSQVLN